MNENSFGRVLFRQKNRHVQRAGEGLVRMKTKKKVTEAQKSRKLDCC